MDLKSERERKGRKRVNFHQCENIVNFHQCENIDYCMLSIFRLMSEC